VDTSRNPLPRQALLFVIVGLAQLALDSAAYIALTALGVPVPAGNLAGRIAGACLGFWLNGRFTFANGGPARLDRRHLLRFLLAWAVLTALSTLALAQVAQAVGLQGSWIAKPVVELVLAALSFFVWRNWVYR
jgi:putative flippase GtrA